MLHQSEEFLRQKYVEEEWCTTQIAKYCDVSHKTISRWMAKFNIPTRDSQLRQLAPSARRKREILRERLAHCRKKLTPTIKSTEPNWSRGEIGS